MIETHIKISGQHQPAVMTLATLPDRELVDTWVADYQEAATLQTNDILEYVEDALTKQEKYAARDRCPGNWSDFLAQARVKKSKEEVAGLFVLKCPALANEIVGFTFLRRNWDGNLVMDYLARCPVENLRLERVSSIGFGLMLAVCKLAQAIEAPHFWWETTPLSSEFYRKKLLKKAAVRCRIVNPASILIISRKGYLRLITYLQNPPLKTTR